MFSSLEDDLSLDTCAKCRGPLKASKWTAEQRDLSIWCARGEAAVTPVPVTSPPGLLVLRLSKLDETLRSAGAKRVEKNLILVGPVLIQVRKTENLGEALRKFKARISKDTIYLEGQADWEDLREALARHEILDVCWIAESCQGAGFRVRKGSKFIMDCKKQDDSIKVTVLQDDGVVFRITSKSGIGEGTVTLADGSWPKETTLVFAPWAEYLENLSLDSGDVRLSVRLRSGETKSIWPTDKGELVIESTQKVIMVKLPPGFCSKSLRLSWIDAYRR
jgi:hypothetical protein